VRGHQGDTEIPRPDIQILAAGRDADFDGLRIEE